MSVLSRSSKKSITTLSFRYGTRMDDPPFGEEQFPVELNLCDGNEEVTIGTRTYYPLPSIEFELPEDRLGFGESSARIRLPLKIHGHEEYNSFLDEVSSGVAFAPVFVRVAELVKLHGAREDQEKEYELFSGDLDATSRFADEARNIVRFEITSEKASFEVPLGMQLNHTCPFSYGGNGCFKPNLRVPYDPATRPNGLGLNAYIQIFGTERDFKVNVYSLDPAQNNWLRGQPPGWWEKGYLERRGLRLMIREWAANTNLFVTVKQCPPSWEGTVFDRRPVLLVPGCSKTITACRARQRENNFGGLGFSIPAYPPTSQFDDR